MESLCAPSASPSAPPGGQRLGAIDIVRGIAMVVMMLDHTRDLCPSTVMTLDPTNLAQTTPMLFLTRWVTHFCAPIFVLLAGTSAFFQASRKSKSELSGFLLTRGLWLVFLELTLIRFLIWWNLDPHFVAWLQVIWAIGVSMVVLAGLIRLPLWAIAVFGLGMMALHNGLDSIRIPAFEGPNSPAAIAWQVVWMLLHQPGLISLGGGTYGFVLYPLIPWIGVMAVGYVLGALYQWEPERRRKILWRIGLGLTLAFVGLRLANGYGDPQKWAVQPAVDFAVISFLNVTKYPASLLFLLMTLGPAIAALAFSEGAGSGIVARALITFGRVPLFFYVLQWFTARALGVLAGWITGYPVGWESAPLLLRPGPDTVIPGFGLGAVYLFWLAGVFLLFPLCRWYMGVKQRHKDWWWLSYL